MHPTNTIKSHPTVRRPLPPNRCVPFTVSLPNEAPPSDSTARRQTSSSLTPFTVPSTETLFSATTPPTNI